MQADPTLSAFIYHRKDLLSQLADASEELDRWFDSSRLEAPAISVLATLEGLFVRRKDLFEQLIKLDDDVLEYLIRRRSRPD